MNFFQQYRKNKYEPGVIRFGIACGWFSIKFGSEYELRYFNSKKRLKSRRKYYTFFRGMDIMRKTVSLAFASLVCFGHLIKQNYLNVIGIKFKKWKNQGLTGKLNNNPLEEKLDQFFICHSILKICFCCLDMNILTVTIVKL